MEPEEIEDGAKAQAVDDVAEGAADDQAEGDGRPAHGSAATARRQGRRRWRRAKPARSQGATGESERNRLKLMPRFQAEDEIEERGNARSILRRIHHARRRIHHLLTWSSSSASDRDSEAQARGRRRRGPTGSYSAAARGADRLGAAAAEAGMAVSLPTSGSTCQQRSHLSPSAGSTTHADIRHVGQREGAGRRCARLQASPPR